MNKKQSKVSIVIPVYNNEEYVIDCLNSIKEQTYKNLEIIVINDGSTDRTLDKLKEFKNVFKNIKIVTIKNQGQGYARNLGLTKTTGKYIMFIDSDDFIDKNTIEFSVEKIESENSDLVFFDWEYYYSEERKFKYKYYNNLFDNKKLEGKECLKILDLSAYFTVNKLYRKSFLMENNIRYSEGHIYEDAEFWVKVAIKAKKISILHGPFYKVRLHDNSSTKTNYHDDTHMTGFLLSVEKSLNIIKESKYKSEDFVDLYKYFITKFFRYRKKRIPKKMHKDFTVKFLNLMKDTKIDKNVNHKNKLLKLIYKYNVFKRRDLFLFNTLYFLKEFVQKLKKYKNNTKEI